MEVTITTETAVAAITEVLERRRGHSPEITPRTKLSDLNLDSLDVAEIFIAIELAIETRLDPASAQGLELVSDLAKLRPAASAASA